MIFTASAIAFGPSSKTNVPDALVIANCDNIRISSPDKALVKIFKRAQITSHGSVGNDNDPVGPWYEAALPNREVFCIRDVSHQCIGAEILWQGKQNLNISVNGKTAVTAEAGKTVLD